MRTRAIVNPSQPRCKARAESGYASFFLFSGNEASADAVEFPDAAEFPDRRNVCKTRSLRSHTRRQRIRGFMPVETEFSVSPLYVIGDLSR